VVLAVFIPTPKIGGKDIKQGAKFGINTEFVIEGSVSKFHLV